MGIVSKPAVRAGIDLALTLNSLSQLLPLFSTVVFDSDQCVDPTFWEGFGNAMDLNALGCISH